MKTTLLALILPIALMASASAENTANTGNNFKFVFGAGVTAGGDKLDTVNYTDGTSSNVNAGAGLALLAGVEYRVAPQFSVQGTVGYHIRFTPEASNGDADFSRIPVELLGYYHINDQWRVGGGVRYVSNAKLSGSGAASSLNRNYQNTTGAVVEVEYLFNKNMGFKVRGVNESFKPEGSSKKFSGNHIGFLFNYYL